MNSSHYLQISKYIQLCYLNSAMNCCYKSEIGIVRASKLINRPSKWVCMRQGVLKPTHHPWVIQWSSHGPIRLLQWFVGTIQFSYRQFRISYSSLYLFICVQLKNSNSLSNQRPKTEGQTSFFISQEWKHDYCWPALEVNISDMLPD